MKVFVITEDVNPQMIRNHLDDSMEFHNLPCKTEEEIIENCQEAECLVTVYEPLSAGVLDKLPNLKYICSAAIGFNNIDVNHAVKNGVFVSNNPFYCIEEVADHTMSLALDLVRKTSLFNRDVKEKKVWDYQAYGNSLFRMSSQVIGLIGFGGIAREVSKRFLGFGCTVLAYDPFVNESVFDSGGVSKASLEEIQKNADIISIHLPLNDETNRMINHDFFTELAKSPFLINCSRGQLIDQSAIKEALDCDYIKGIALDVLDDEYPRLEEIDFIEDDRVVITPHVAFFSQSSIDEADYNVADYINMFAKDEIDRIPMVGKPLR